MADYLDHRVGLNVMCRSLRFTLLLCCMGTPYAYAVEYEGLQAAGTVTFTGTRHKECHVVDSIYMWVYTRKTGTRGAIEKVNARLVAQSSS